MLRFRPSRVFVHTLLLFSLVSFAASTFSILNAEGHATSNSTQPDWLLVPPSALPPVTLSSSQCSDGSSGHCEDGTTTIVLSNSLISRTFAISPFFATTDFVNVQDPHSGSLLRGVSPVGRITLDGVEYDIGR